MTREEEIIKASHLYASAFQKPFMDGAMWADRTMIDRACKWLKSKGGFTIGFDGATVRDFLNYINK